MTAPTTLTELIERAAKSRRAMTYIDGENDEHSVGFEQLHSRALGILHHLQELGVRAGDHLILFLSGNEPFIDAFWAAVLGGIVPVPVAVGISDEHRHKLLRIARRLGSPWIYTERKTFERIGAFAEKAGESGTFDALRRRAWFTDQLEDVSTPGTPRRAAPDDIAFIQFSSGSTSEPKGIVLTHGNLIANWHGAATAAQFTADDVSLSWMPLTHDMGLIGMHIFMTGSGMDVNLMPTELFVRRPLLWLQFASRKRATLLSSPNFGYRHYLKVLGDRSVDALDLSAVRLIFNGAEPISASLCSEFLERMAPARLRATSMYPVYGLAEASVAVSFPAPQQPMQLACLDRHSLGTGETAQHVPCDSPAALRLVGVGSAIPGCELRLAGDDDAPLGAGRIGHIQIRGANVTRGYFGGPRPDPALTTADGWVRTGDLGLQHEGQLFITGRAKEIIFVNGQNYYPHDLEGIAIQCAGLELGKVVVSGVRRRGAATDELVVFVLHRGETRDFLATATEVARRLNEQSGLEVAEVVPVKRIPKTTSGKIQRHLLEEELLSGAFDAELAELQALRAALRGPAGQSGSEIESKLKAVCDAALDGRTIGVNDNLFDLGARSTSRSTCSTRTRSTSRSCSTTRPSPRSPATCRPSSPRLRSGRAACADASACVTRASPPAPSVSAPRRAVHNAR
jgi:acyl-CoA synthetase (AMP-forming)/AMP-acid ligase II